MNVEIFVLFFFFSKWFNVFEGTVMINFCGSLLRSWSCLNVSRDFVRYLKIQENTEKGNERIYTHLLVKFISKLGRLFQN